MSFFALGSVFIAGSVAAAGGTAAVIGVGLAGAALEATAYSAYSSSKSYRNAAGVDTAVAAFNANYDESLAKQLDLDTLQNIRTERENNNVYLSREAASYAAAGVLATTGTPLHAQITNAGRMEQQIQQEYVNSQQKQKSYHEQAKAGVAMGEAQASSDRMAASLALINGGAKMAGMVYGGYQSGVFG